jgi:CRISPR system Cascade subunit CasE
MAQHGLWDSYAWHQAIWDIFPGREHKKRDFLFRLDSMRNNTRLLLLSPVPPILPEWGEGSTKKISSAFLGHNAYQFQLKANPVKRLRETGKRVGIYCEEELVNWIHRKGETGGFEIFQEYLNVSPPMAEYFNRNGRKGKHISVDFSGVLQVRNPQHFENAFYNGIGPAKAFGFGMLMLQPI